jgi:small multidrug resistance pump
MNQPSWMKTVLRLAAIYNLLWGAWVVLFPLHQFELFQMEAPNYPELWQCVGMIVGVYGIGYWLAANDPVRHYPIVVVGLLGKILGPIGFAQALYLQRFPPAFGLNIIFNDLIWWIPFTLILLKSRPAPK